MDFFIITFRETLEAAIIIGLIFSMLKLLWVKKKKKRYISVWIILWIIMSFVFAIWFEKIFWGFTGKVEKIYEWILMIVACAMITQFIIWTNANFKDIWKTMKNNIEKIITSKQLWILSILAFVSVVREWVETVIFFNALDFSLASNDSLYAIAGIIGAIIISYFLFFTIKKINIAKVLRYTNLLFIVIAGWLLAHGIVEFQWANIIPTFVKPLFDLSNFLSEKEWVWAIFKAAFSYDANPSLIAFTAHITYIIAFWYYYFLRKKKA